MYVTTLGNPVSLGPWLGEQPAPQIDWCQRRQAIAAAARAEEARWTAPNGVKILENHPTRLPILTDYWSAVPGINAAYAATRSALDDPDWPWSAAFICYVMQQAGVVAGQGFEFGRRHINYIVGALRNRERSDRNRPFWLVDRIEIQREAIPQAGDLLCFNRCAPATPQDVCGGQPGMRRTTHTYESLRNRFWTGDPAAIPVGSSHCSIVVGTVQIGAQRFVETIGGNETNSVRIARIPADQHGGIPNPQAHHIFGMIKIVGC